MTRERLGAVENRIDRLEEVLTSAGNFLLQASELTRQNATDTSQLTRHIDNIDQKLDLLTDRVNSLTAASERHDRVLDYLLSQSGDANGSAN